MKEYVFTSKLFAGNIVFGYNDDGILIKFVNEATLSNNQMLYLSKNFPFAESELQRIVGANGKIEEIQDVSFERFWRLYDKKVNRKRSEDLWYKLSEGDRQTCLQKIPKYKTYCRLQNRYIKDADTFLRNRTWEDEM
jgi:hypothetical protein